MPISSAQSAIGLRLMHTVGSLRQSAGGPSRTVTALCRELGRLGAQVDLVSLDLSRLDNDENLVPAASLVKTTLVSPTRIPVFGSRLPIGLGSAMRACCRNSEIQLVHDHGVWLPNNHTTALIARESRVPLIVSPRGMLEPWALKHRSWKKRFAWVLYQARDLLYAKVLHATSEQEVENLRRFGMRQPIALIPNGCDFPSLDDCSRFAVWGEEGPRVGEHVRTALFLSRIHPKKGLLQFVEAWGQLRPQGWRVVIAGPDEAGHRAEVEARIHQQGLFREFEFVGSVKDQEKAALFKSADLFVLPTLSENFGVVVAEALANGVPVLTTKGAPWQVLETHQCGWWVDLGIESLIAGLRQATSVPTAELRAMGERGRSYAKSHFGWPGIAQQMVSVYRWLLGDEDRPRWVQLY